MPAGNVYTVPVSEPACGLPPTSLPPLLTCIEKSAAVFVPPLSFTTCLITRSVPVCCTSENVHVQFSPSFMLMATEGLAPNVDPPLADVTVQTMPVSDQKLGNVSATL